MQVTATIVRTMTCEVILDDDYATGEEALDALEAMEIEDDFFYETELYKVIDNSVTPSKIYERTFG